MSAGTMVRPAQGRWRLHAPVVRLFKLVTPQEGWLAVLLLLASLLVVVWTINAARWVEAPSLAGVVVVGALAGMLVAKLRGPSVAWHLLALLGGAALVYWSTAALADSEGWLDRFRELNTRLELWWHTARGEGIGIDTLPFAFGLGALGWVLAYFSAWAAFRLHNLWLSVLPGGLALTSAMSYLPDDFAPRLVLYLFVTMVFAVRMTVLQREREWKRSGLDLRTGPGAGGSAGRPSAAGAPLPPGVPASDQDRRARRGEGHLEQHPSAPVQDAEGGFGRLFAGLPSRRPHAFRSFGAFLPFQGSDLPGGRAALPGADGQGALLARPRLSRLYAAGVDSGRRGGGRPPGRASSWVSLAGTAGPWRWTTRSPWSTRRPPCPCRRCPWRAT